MASQLKGRGKKSALLTDTLFLVKGEQCENMLEFIRKAFTVDQESLKNRSGEGGSGENGWT